MNNKKIVLILILLVTIIVIGIFLVLYFPIKHEMPYIEKVQPLKNGLDYGFMWNITENLSNVVHNYSKNFSKGRQFGSWGCENWTANFINESMDEIGLESKKIQLGPLKDFPKRGYTSFLDVQDYELVIHYPNSTYKNILKSEVFPGPSSWPPTMNLSRNEKGLTYRYDFKDEDKIIAYKPPNKIWPLGGTLTGDFVNITCTPLNQSNLIVGEVEYITVNQSIPTDQIGKVFIVDEMVGYKSLLNNITNATAVVLIPSQEKKLIDLQVDTLDNLVFPVFRMDYSTKNNNQIDNITMMLTKGKKIIADNAQNNGTITFTYNIESKSIWPNSNFFYIKNSENPTFFRVHVTRLLRFLSLTVFQNRPCKGIIWFLDSDDETHDMLWRNVEWFRIKNHIGYGISFPALPEFFVNKSVGTFLTDCSEDPQYTISGFIEQIYLEEKDGYITINNLTTKNIEIIDESSSEEHFIGKSGIEAYNVEGKIPITASPDDKIVVISNRHDSWWGECPGDSGAGAGIVLSIAKYFKDFGIIPKYNLTFLQTTGEEFGYRGAQHYSDSHLDDNIFLFIGMDQLGFEQENTTGAILQK